MTENFVEDDGAVRVQGKPGVYRSISVPVGFREDTFRDALACVYSLWMRDGRFPTVEECARYFPAIPTSTYGGLFETPEFKEALEYRGVAFDPKMGLTAQQLNVLLALDDPSDRRSIGAKLAALGVPMARYKAWLKNPNFTAERDRQTKENWDAMLPELRNTVMSEALAGNTKMMELWLAKTGEYNPANEATQDAMQIVQVVVDAVVSRVKDVEVRRAILADVEAAIVGLSARKAIGGG